MHANASSRLPRLCSSKWHQSTQDYYRSEHYKNFGSAGSQYQNVTIHSTICRFFLPKNVHSGLTMWLGPFVWLEPLHSQPEIEPSIPVKLLVLCPLVRASAQFCSSNVTNMCFRLKTVVRGVYWERFKTTDDKWSVSSFFKDKVIDVCPNLPNTSVIWWLYYGKTFAYANRTCMPHLLNSFTPKSDQF